ncbi:sulfotransferase 1C2-like [Stegodyphus dumicola]|uniref:sulfotransferase 1C2-like n=1 Tax=Stegodyphus dumicola TaxID=202533 RepID=UPI0015B0D748|nr:sulfotransferase 1C2-like [Stegodyphus dumicola]
MVNIIYVIFEYNLQVLNYKPTPNDVFIVTYPKCGTTWMQNIVMYIFRKGQEMDHPHDFLRLCPFLDMMGAEGIFKMPRPGALKTHISFTHVPYSPKSKYIFVTRNPKDCCVSFYYHTKNDLSYGYWDAEFDDFFELFISGEIEDNDYFEHLLSWYPRRNDPNVFYTKYEDMKKDTKSLVIKLARFLGKEYIDTVEQDNTVLNNILNLSSFEYMKKHLSDIYEIEPGSPLMNDYEGIRYVSEFMKTLELTKEPPKSEFIRLEIGKITFPTLNQRDLTRNSWRKQRAQKSSSGIH